MSREEAKRRAELYQALADGKTLQIKESANTSMGIQGIQPKWFDISHNEAMTRLCNLHLNELRIKPEPKKQWYRVGKCYDGKTTWTAHVDTNFSENELQHSRFFVEWFSDRIEYELPEGE